MNINFDRCIVVVTGAARGIGRGIVEGFAARGATVFAADILPQESYEAGPGSGGHILPQLLDVTDSNAVASLVGEAQARTGHIDVLVHVAGGIRGQVPKAFESVTDAEWDAIYDVNVKGAFLMARAVTSGMKAAGKGRIIVILRPRENPKRSHLRNPGEIRIDAPCDFGFSRGRSISRAAQAWASVVPASSPTALPRRPSSAWSANSATSWGSSALP